MKTTHRITGTGHTACCGKPNYLAIDQGDALTSDPAAITCGREPSVPASGLDPSGWTATTIAEVDWTDEDGDQFTHTGLWMPVNPKLVFSGGWMVLDGSALIPHDQVTAVRLQRLVPADVSEAAERSVDGSAAPETRGSGVSCGLGDPGPAPAPVAHDQCVTRSDLAAMFRAQASGFLMAGPWVSGFEGMADRLDADPSPDCPDGGWHRSESCNHLDGKGHPASECSRPADDGGLSPWQAFRAHLIAGDVHDAHTVLVGLRRGADAAFEVEQQINGLAGGGSNASSVATSLISAVARHVS